MHYGKIKSLMSRFDNPREIYHASEKSLKSISNRSNPSNINNVSNITNTTNTSDVNDNIKINSITDVDILRICKSRKEYSFDREKEKLDKQNIRFITVQDREYPNKLRHIYNPPYGIFVKGNIIDDSRPSVAIVGARNCTIYGKKMAEHFAGVLSLKGVSVVSGMARGIDTSAHKGALINNGDTYAILGCGVNICYPHENINIYTDMQAKGGIISEYPPGSEPLKWHFPARNRIISGLSDVVIVVEAKERSGSLITVEYALEQGKDVYAIPGRIDDELSKGCNAIIKAGAGLLTSPDDVIEQLKSIYIINDEISQKEKYPIAKEFEVVYSVLDLCPKNIDTIIEETGLSSEEVLGKLLKLQLMNLVEEHIKGYYTRRY